MPERKAFDTKENVQERHAFVSREKKSIDEILRDGLFLEDSDADDEKEDNPFERWDKLGGPRAPGAAKRRTDKAVKLWESESESESESEGEDSRGTVPAKSQTAAASKQPWYSENDIKEGLTPAGGRRGVVEKICLLGGRLANSVRRERQEHHSGLRGHSARPRSASVVGTARIAIVAISPASAPGRVGQASSSTSRTPAPASAPGRVGQASSSTSRPPAAPCSGWKPPFLPRKAW